MKRSQTVRDVGWSESEVHTVKDEQSESFEKSRSRSGFKNERIIVNRKNTF